MSQESLGVVLRKLRFLVTRKKTTRQMQDQTMQWLSVMLGSLLFLDACRWVVTRLVVAGRVGGDTPRSCTLLHTRLRSQQAMMKRWRLH